MYVRMCACARVCVHIYILICPKTSYMCPRVRHNVTALHALIKQVVLPLLICRRLMIRRLTRALIRIARVHHLLTLLPPASPRCLPSRPCRSELLRTQRSSDDVQVIVLFEILVMLARCVLVLPCRAPLRHLLVAEHVGPCRLLCCLGGWKQWREFVGGDLGARAEKTARREYAGERAGMNECGDMGREAGYLIFLHTV